MYNFIMFNVIIIQYGQKKRPLFFFDNLFALIKFGSKNIFLNVELWTYSIKIIFSSPNLHRIFFLT